MIDPQALPLAARVHPDARPARRITFDSREAGPDTAFAALRGETAHGNDYAQAALEAGAPFVLTDLDLPRAVQVPDARAALRAWARHARDTHAHPVVGITGSVGKTTAKEYAAAALGAEKTPGNLNTLDAIACFLLEHAGEDRPLVVEMGIDRPGEMAELMALVSPDYGIVTAVGESHLEALGSVEGVAREKGGILQARRAGLVSVQAAAFYPGVPTYGFEGASYGGENLHTDLEAARFRFRGVDVTLPAASPVVAEAAVLGLALAAELGLDLPTAAARLRDVDVPGGRYRVHRGPITFIDDTYNANPLSMRAALEALARYPGRRVAVLGEMRELGPDSDHFHREIAAFARAHADVVYSFGDRASLLSDRPFETVEALVAALTAELRPGDTVLFKASRGVRLERVLSPLLEAQRA
ncbi:UDP-N-acetylmuramoyl-tripeptide--D-alanyl-D-alanine ligase [Deinobacterium chartae]|uniref:UDP-N-acetylmuramoyl-tripeptide--D-alanyl-D-alanine ligase n=1 Tax=Deinobacterium chartae TaxID=521158 RepID=A0A841I1S4_9DEIO|nr:UDP-N-acetylmuramoyl-tripeptide--D-alanyl-D-alanine ligase [Deinobacterium chartae]MBB6098012.1 UDP-N-acetylmuramoyl-tripeptide--D-alanyl-D-alanine ligase [Deinobacterium chartae]